MKLLAVADLHVGAPMRHRENPRVDQRANLSRICEVAVEHNVDLVLIAGDVFDHPRPTPATLHLFAEFVRDLEAEGIPAIAVHGNAAHDGGAADEPTALELFRSDTFGVSRTPELFTQPGIAVCTLPNVPPGRMRALLADCGMLGETNETIAQLLVQVAADLRADVPPGMPCVLLGHWSVSGASLPNGMASDTLGEPVIPLDALEAQGWDAIVLGHLHRFQDLDGAPGAYCGSPMILNYGEAEYEHGVVLLEFDPVSFEFVPLPDREFRTVSVDLVEALAEGDNGSSETDAFPRDLSRLAAPSASAAEVLA